jgi:23S rRNA-/tRNA-specific pseudouridylate synthase
MKYNFIPLQQSISYLKNVYWYRNQYSNGNLKKFKEIIELYRSKDFLIVNKPYDLIAYNFSNKKTENLLEILKDKYEYLYDPRVKGGFRVLHRIDTVCSGCFCIPLTPISNKLGFEAFLKHRVSKYYLALVYGHVKNETGKEFFEIQVPIGDDLNNKGHLICTKYDSQGTLMQNCVGDKNAKTLVKVLEHGSYNEKPCSKVLLRLVTGRRHQLRVHLNFIGHQIVGDTSYGLDDYDTYRTMLHAYAFSMKLKDKTIEAIAEDPFRNEIDGCWKSNVILNKIENILA